MTLARPDAAVVRLGLVIAAGGALGAVARWLVERAWPVESGSIPWSTLAVNVCGCVAIGALMVAMDRGLSRRVYARPFIGVGLLGGFTTFSTFAVETRALVDSEPALALAYLVGTPALAILAAIVGALFATSALDARVARRAEERRP